MINPSEIIFGSLLVAVLVGLGVYFGRRQLLELRRLRDESLPDEEMRYERRKAWRRLVSSSLMLVLAALLVVVVVAGIPAEKVGEELREAAAAGLTDEQKATARVFGWSLIVFLLVLLVVLALAGIDLWETRRFGLRQFRKLQADRRAMIQRQTNRLRQERNGDG